MKARGNRAKPPVGSEQGSLARPASFDALEQNHVAGLVYARMADVLYERTVGTGNRLRCDNARIVVHRLRPGEVGFNGTARVIVRAVDAQKIRCGAGRIDPVGHVLEMVDHGERAACGQVVTRERVARELPDTAPLAACR
jgi:hypothetical protein